LALTPLSPDRFFYHIPSMLPCSESTCGNCDRNTVPDELKVCCARILYDGQLVKFYKGQGLNGTVLLKYDGFADEV
jgi:hypothetical protein